MLERGLERVGERAHGRITVLGLLGQSAQKQPFDFNRQIGLLGSLNL